MFFARCKLLLCVSVLSVSSQLAHSQEQLTVRDSWTPSGLQAAWHWALEKDLFKKNGLDVAYEDGNGSTTTVQLVASSKFDVGFTDLSVMAVGRDKGMPLTSVCGLIRKTSLGVFVPKGSGLKTPKDLEGKEVIYTATSFEAPFIDPFLRAGGTSREKVKLTSVDAAAKVSTYADGHGDGMITSIPYGAPYVNKKRPSDNILFGDYGLVLPSYGLVVREDTLRNMRAAIQKLAAVFRDSWQAIIDGGDKTVAEAADIIIKRRPDAKLDRDTTIELIKDHIPYFYTENTKEKPLCWQSEADWQATIKDMEEAKVVKARTKPTDYFTNDLIKVSVQ